jgi:hypothetical protein
MEPPASVRSREVRLSPKPMSNMSAIRGARARSRRRSGGTFGRSSTGPGWATPGRRDPGTPISTGISSPGIVIILHSSTAPATSYPRGVVRGCDDRFTQVGSRRRRRLTVRPPRRRWGRLTAGHLVREDDVARRSRDRRTRASASAGRSGFNHDQLTDQRGSGKYGWTDGRAATAG